MSQKVTVSRKKVKKADDEVAKHTNNDAMAGIAEKKKAEMLEYAFNRIRHPRKQVITEESLMKCLNDYDISITKSVGNTA